MLPPRPAPRTRKAAETPAPETVDFANIHNLTAVGYRITLSDGTYLRAEGELADLIYRYLTECEKFCALEQKINYVGPSFSRFSPEGEKLAQKPGQATSVI